MSTSAPPLQIPIPTVTIAWGAGQTYLSNTQPIAADFAPKLGHPLLLTNVGAQIDCFAQYKGEGAAAGDYTWSGTSVPILPTFELFKNGVAIFQSSAQIQMQPVQFNGTNLFGATNQYGVFSDFVNPILFTESDILTVGLGITGFPLAAIPDDAPNPPTAGTSNVWSLFAMTCGIQAGGTLSLTQAG